MAYHNLGAVLRQGGKLEQAIASYDWALALDPDHADTHYNRGNVLRQMGRFEEARVAYHRALALSDDHVGAYTCLGHVLYRLDRVDEARQIFRRWLERDPDHPVPGHMLAACSEGPAPERASDGYVETIFDNLAGAYDESLGSLDYRGPALVGSMLAGSLGDPLGELDVLDAGCGTGLCAALLRDYASRLTGVDLSPGMLERARERGVYDELVRSELTEFLGEQGEAYDLVVSADTFVYFGELVPVLNAVAGALRPGGWLVFTLERAEDDPERGFVLQPHGRYSHGRGYVERVLADAGLEVEIMTDDVLRSEAGRPVRGWLVLARKGA
jgi:predicted TPR repeat methyltransferase